MTVTRHGEPEPGIGTPPLAGRLRLGPCISCSGQVKPAIDVTIGAPLPGVEAGPWDSGWSVSAVPTGRRRWLVSGTAVVAARSAASVGEHRAAQQQRAEDDQYRDRVLDPALHISSSWINGLTARWSRPACPGVLTLPQARQTRLLMRRHPPFRRGRDGRCLPSTGQARSINCCCLGLNRFAATKFGRCVILTGPQVDWWWHELERPVLQRGR